MKIRFKGNYPKHIDGEAVGPFRLGEEREVDDPLARKFIASDMAEAVIEPEVAPEPVDEVPEVDLDRDQLVDD